MNGQYTLDADPLVLARRVAWVLQKRKRDE